MASVARRRGSLPMSATAKILVPEQGARIGTVGGGCLEADIVLQSHAVMQSGVPTIVTHTLNASEAGDYGLTCGGTATVLLEPVYPDPVLAAIYAACAFTVRSGGYGVLATALDWGASPQKMFVASDGTVTGANDPALHALARALGPAANQPMVHEHGGGTVLEPVAGAPPLTVFGGGHVGARVAEAAAFAGWRVTVCDDRPEYADAARLPFAARTVVCDPGDVSAAGPFGSDGYAVVATRGHQHDALIMDQLARLDLRYLGMLGSRRKVALTWSLLEQWGVPPDRLALVHAPVGLSIGADTPAEIAVSVVAEMIAVRRGGSTLPGRG